ncbi:phage tail tip lysozyme [Pseudomonas tohonis]|uniref:phage tail tip lysozyme n=1 Tax=Pseudomonas tohonis TaxID=2725477 RepID=UPI001F34A549|nr:phage tail tip lysozyme [Pseudomonas tohonis]
MADQDVIKEFLVQLGFKVDDKGQKKFTSGIDDATRAVTRLVTTITGASLAVAAGVSAFASNLEGLYFASQRIGASANSLRAADYAARDLGASAGEVRNSLEGLARFMRDNPGGEGYLKSLGVQTRDANGNLRDTTDLLATLGQKLSAMPWYQAKQYAGLFGIDDNTLRAIQNPEFAQRLERNRSVLQNSGMDKATQDAHAFMEQLRGIGLQFESFSVKVQAALMEKLGPDLARFAVWFEQNGPMIAERIADIAKAIVDMGEDAGPYLRQFVDFFVQLDRATDGWSTKLIAAAAALRVVAGAGGVGGLAKGAGVVGAGAGGYWLGTEINNWLDGFLSEKAGRKTNLGFLLYEMFNDDKGFDPGPAAPSAAAAGASGMSRSDLSTFVMDYFQEQGWTRSQAAGIAANLGAESNFDPRAVGDSGQARGIAQWHPDRQAAFKQWAGFDIGDQRADLVKQLEFVQHELTRGAEQRAGQLLAATQNAQDAGAVVSRYYERPRAADAEAASRGAAAVQMSQTTNITVQGGSDPTSTAQAVAGAQGRVNEEMTRNLNSAVVN